MKLSDIRNLTNARLAGEQLTYSALLPYFDAVVDEINSKLHSKFRTFTEVNRTGIGEPSSYEDFPDKYIRTVVCIGAAAKWYIDDEEGIETATALKMQYDNNLFVMLRDYGPLVPEEFKADSNSGYLEDCAQPTALGLNPDIRYIPVKGLPGTSVESLWVQEVNGALHLYARLLDYTQGSRVIDCGIIEPKTFSVSYNKALEPGNFVNAIGFEIEEV